MGSPVKWPESPEGMMLEQRRLAPAGPEPYYFDVDDHVGGCFICFERGGTGDGRAGDAGWGAAVVTQNGVIVAQAVTPGRAGGPYSPGLLALREGPLLEKAVRALRTRPAVLLVNATGRDHPRGAGMALHLGAVLDMPTVGVTDRTLIAVGEEPGPDRGAISPLYADDVLVGYRLRTRAAARTIAVTSAWRTSPETAVNVARAATLAVRTPEPIRVARRLAREARADDSGAGAVA